MAEKSGGSRKIRAGLGFIDARSRQPPPEATYPAAGLYIAQVSEMLGISATMIRRWEALRFIEPLRAPSGFRVYTTGDLGKLRTIRDLVRSGLNPEGVRRELAKAGDEVAVPGPKVEQGAVGSRLHRLRKTRGKSLRQLAQEANLSASHLSSIERSLTHPSVAVLQGLAAALGTNMIEILGGEVRREQLVVRPSQRRPLDGYLPGVEIQQLFRVETVLESLLFIVNPGAGSGDAYRHSGEEFLFMLEGELRIVLDGTEVHRLRVGDAMTFASHRPHSFNNPGKCKSRVLWINTPPTF